jgi:hypothetical protein
MLPTWAIQLIFIAALIGGGYFYYTTTQAKIARQQETIITLEMANEINESTISSLTRAIKFNAEEYSALLKKLQTSDDYKDSLLKIFGEHDLTRLSVAKPGLIENRINAGTRKVFDDIESITTPDGL